MTSLNLHWAGISQVSLVPTSFDQLDYYAVGLLPQHVWGISCLCRRHLHFYVICEPWGARPLMLRSREIILSFFPPARTRTAGMSGERASHYTTNSSGVRELVGKGGGGGFVSLAGAQSHWRAHSHVGFSAVGGGGVMGTRACYVIDLGSMAFFGIAEKSKYFMHIRGVGEYFAPGISPFAL